MSERKVPNPDDPGAKLVPADGETLTREAVAILSAFRRFSVEQIAVMLNLAPASVLAIQDDAETSEQIDTLGALLPRPGDLHELLMTDAERNIRWIRDLRDGRVDGVQIGQESTVLNVRARAAALLLERQVAKKVDVLPPTLRTYDITDLQMGRMRKLLDAPPVVEVVMEPTPVGKEPGAGRGLTDADFDT